MEDPLLEARKPWNYGRKVFNWKPDLHPRGRDGRFINVFKKILNMNIGDSRDLSDIVADAPNIQEATAWRTREGWEMRTRANDGTYGTKISTRDVQENDSVFDDVLQMVNGLQGFPELPVCPCGCGNKSKNGQFLYGHQERQRDALNKKAMAGDAAAADTLADMPPEWYDGFNMPGENNEPDRSMLDQLRDEFGDEKPEPVPDDPKDTPEQVRDARAILRVIDFIAGEHDIRENIEDYLRDEHDMDWHPDEGPDWAGAEELKPLFWNDNPITKMKALGFNVDRWMDRIREWDPEIANDPWDWYGGMDDSELADLAAELMHLANNLHREVNKLEKMHRRYNQRMGWDRSRAARSRKRKGQGPERACGRWDGNSV